MKPAWKGYKFPGAKNLKVFPRLLYNFSIPHEVIHFLMADLHLRIRKTDNRVVVITADGRDWMTRAD